jgi:hypothetical protein
MAGVVILDLWGVPQPHHPFHSRTADQSSGPCLPSSLSNSPALHSTHWITPPPPCPALASAPMPPCPYAALPRPRPLAPAHSLGLHQLVVPKLCKERLEQALVGYQEPLPAALEQVLEGDACREAARSGGASVARTSVRQEGGPWCAGGRAGCRGNCAAGGQAGGRALMQAVCREAASPGCSPCSPEWSSCAPAMSLNTSRALWDREASTTVALCLLHCSPRPMSMEGMAAGAAERSGRVGDEGRAGWGGGGCLQCR